MHRADVHPRKTEALDAPAPPEADRQAAPAELPLEAPAQDAPHIPAAPTPTRRSWTFPLAVGLLTLFSLALWAGIFAGGAALVDALTG